MKYSVKLTIVFGVWLLLAAIVKPSKAMAAAKLTLSPGSGSYSTGQTFKVTIGIDSGSDTSAAVDVWGNFDSDKLEIVSLERAADPAFSFQLEPHVDNDSGKFDFACASNDASQFTDQVLKGDLAVVTFKAKNTGTASVNFSCTNGSDIDSNVFKTNGTDIIECGSNGSGSYTITAGAGGEPEVTTPAPTGTLPRTGSPQAMIGMMVFGLISVLGGIAVKFL